PPSEEMTVAPATTELDTTSVPALTTPSPTTADRGNETDGGASADEGSARLSDVGIAGVAIGVFYFCVLIALSVCFVRVVRRRREQQQEPSRPAEPFDEIPHAVDVAAPDEQDSESRAPDAIAVTVA
ncbi:MAG: hypothetical protein Q8J97_12220, partial [Flavobacteriaceae bacterium]|nr:hypothetical protein [Flavobacteriaceae bacterium]